MASSLESIGGSSDVVALQSPMTHQVQGQKRTWLSTVGASSLVLGVVVVTLGLTGTLTGTVDIFSPSLHVPTGKVATLESVGVGEGASHSDIVSVLPPQDWPQIQDILCPAGIPDTTFGATLFSVARAQLGITTNDTIFENERPNGKLPFRFFHHEFQQATTYTHSNGTLAYIPIWKAANMAIRGWMKKSLGHLGPVEDIHTARLFARSRAVKPSCVVTAIRDPVSHFLSGYNEIEFRRRKIANRRVVPPYYQMPYNTPEERHDRFVQFVMDFLSEDKGLQGNPFGHVFSMSRILTELDRVGGFLSGYLPSINNLSTSFPAFVKNTCQLQQDLPLLKENIGKHRSSQDPEGFYQASKDVWSEQGRVAKALCALHAMDYACWKDVADGVPQLCQEVFSSPEFVTAILDG